MKEAYWRFPWTLVLEDLDMITIAGQDVGPSLSKT